MSMINTYMKRSIFIILIFLYSCSIQAVSEHKLLVRAKIIPFDRRQQDKTVPFDRRRRDNNYFNLWECGDQIQRARELGVPYLFEASCKKYLIYKQKTNIHQLFCDIKIDHS